MNVSRPSLGRGGPRGGRGGGGRSFKKDWGTGANDIPLGAKKTTTEGAAAE